ncbi:methyltransferase domain-containing protein [Luteibacter sp. 3190]|uniref:class I SAM-dependent methyltransferase n=1 Tax=Luteibacter sp. 3190 TaxID=2817736 RepID=UPI00285FDD71|nr:methyltransferase domain-containing protein [Luteibacter sp. 3190]MDR6935338.1 SAM-dependent methyltransferase [Luteibacter sp. 3190]
MSEVDDEARRALISKRMAEYRDNWNWIDPCNADRFVRRDLKVEKDATTDAILKNIARLTDQIFDHVSVFENFSEASSRGAMPSSSAAFDATETRAALQQAEQILWDAYRNLEAFKDPFVTRQLDDLGVGPGSKGLKLNIGSANNLLKDWLNVDAGGGDLRVNINWGLPLPDDSVDFVYCAHMLEHLRYSDQAPVFLREVLRVLSKGGTARIVVPDARKLLVAYSTGDRDFFRARQAFYPMYKAFIDDGLFTLDYILMFCGAAPQMLSYSHKFGYDARLLCDLLRKAGFSDVKESQFQGSEHSALRVDDVGYNAQARDMTNHHYSLFIEATK